MNALMIITVGKTIVKYGQMSVNYLKEDYSHWSSLNEAVTIEVHSKGIGRFNFANDTLFIDSPNQDCVILHSEPFDSETRYWNLASIIPDAKEKGGEDDGRDEASLFHDLIDTFQDAIAKANLTTSKEISDWSDGILGIVWRSYGKKKGKAGWWLNTKTWLALNACRLRVRRIWRKAFGVIIISLACLSISGCDDVPEGYSTTPAIHYTTDTNIVEGVR